MIRSVLNGHNLRRASRQVVSNKGSAGIDGIPVQELIGYFDTPEAAMLFSPDGITEKDIQTKAEQLAGFERNKAQIIESIMTGIYLPQPIRGVEIPKDNGKKRLLGIPTVTDRMLQQAVHQIIYPLFEVEFKAGSYGFRPNRNAHQAVLTAQKYINEGYNHIVDIDLKTFFDEVDHCILLQLIYRKVKCPITLRLIRKWLRAPIMINGKLTKRRKGVPQGSPLSPLLSNIMLHELDKELERKGLRYVRYADDFSIYTKSHHSARKTGNDIFLFLRDKMKLPINRVKSGIRKPVNFKILGFQFVSTYQKGEKGQYQMVASEKSWKRFKMNLKAITRKTAPLSFDERIRKLKEVQRGWVNYFRMASIYGKLKDLDGWVRNRLRYCIWHDWKKPEKRRRSLIRLGVKPEQAKSWSRSRMGGWAVAQSPILNTTITLKRLTKRGYQSALYLYLKISPQFNEPLITRPVRSVV
jgi:group II intron reverse transcriptase/maturase